MNNEQKAHIPPDDFHSPLNALKINDHIQVVPLDKREQLEQEGKGKFLHCYYSSYLGCIPKKCLFLSEARSQKQSLNMLLKQSYEFRVLILGVIYVFKSVVEKIVLDPTPYIHIKYPEVFHHADLRSSMRVTLHQPVEIIAKEETPAGIEGQIFLTNISRGGAEISAPIQLAMIGKEIDFCSDFQVQTQVHKLPLKGIVRQIHTQTDPISKNMIIRHGIIFNFDSDANRDIIIKFVDNMVELAQTVHAI